jgi:hypothetical protein
LEKCDPVRPGPRKPANRYGTDANQCRDEREQEQRRDRIFRDAIKFIFFTKYFVMLLLLSFSLIQKFQLGQKVGIEPYDLVLSTSFDGTQRFEICREVNSVSKRTRSFIKRSDISRTATTQTSEMIDDFELGTGRRVLGRSRFIALGIRNCAFLNIQLSTDACRIDFDKAGRVSG